MRIALRAVVSLSLLAFAASAVVAQSSTAAAPATSAAATPAVPAAAAPAAVPAAAPAVPAAAPKIVAVEPVHDVGKVARSEKVEVAFELRNDGEVPLQIHDVRPTCGCTVARYDAKIEPGKTGKVHAAVDTADFSGPISKTLTVLSNDPANPRLTLTIKADVQPQVQLSPGFARFNFVQSQESLSVKQVLWTDNFEGFQVTGVRSPYKFVTAAFHKAEAAEMRTDLPVPNANQWIVETTILPDAELGALRDFLVVTTNHPRQKEVRIPITGFVRPILSVSPYVADFGAVEVSAGVKDLSLIVTNFGKEPVEITKVSTGVTGVEATVRSIEAGKRFEIKLALTPAMPKGAIDSTLKIETSSPLKPTLDVPLKGRVS